MAGRAGGSFLSRVLLGESLPGFSGSNFGPGVLLAKFHLEFNRSGFKLSGIRIVNYRL
jgi:hypothetical protein